MAVSLLQTIDGGYIKYKLLLQLHLGTWQL